MPTMVDFTSSSDSDDADSDCSPRSSIPSEVTTDTEDLNEDAQKDNDIAKNSTENYSIPRTSDLFSAQTLNEALSKIQEKDISSNLLVLKQSLIRYLESRQSRGETNVQKEKFCEVLCNNGLPYEQAERFIRFFDCENVGEIDISSTLDSLRTNFYVSSVDDIKSVIKIFEKNNILPGFFDVHCDELTDCDLNRRRILSFLRRTKLSSTILPNFGDVRYLSIASARTAVARQWLKNAQLKKYDDDLTGKANDFNMATSSESVGDRKILTGNRVYKKLETSSKKSDVGLMTNDDSTTYWQSDGTANSHWIRASMRKDVHIWQIFMGVVASDSSYMPQFIVVSVGNYLSHMREIKEVFIPPDYNGDFLLLGRQNKFFRFVQINIRRCVSDGCDTRVRNLRFDGYRSKASKEKILNETCSSWYLNVLTSTVEACLPVAPSLRSSIMQISLDCVEKLTPFMLAQESTMSSSAFFTPRIFKDVENFLKIVVFDEQCLDEELKSNGIYVIVKLALASGNLDSILNSFRSLLAIKSSKLSLTSAVKLGVSLKKMLHSVVQGLSRRLIVSVVESDGEPNIQWKDILENNSSTKIFRSVAGKRDLHVIFQISNCLSYSSTLIGGVRVRVPTDRQNAARRITVYAVRDKCTVRQFLERSSEISSEKSKVKIIGRCAFIKGNECEIQTEPCLTPYIVVKFSRDDRLTSASGCVEVNSVSFSGIRVNLDKSINTDFDENLSDITSSTTFTNASVASMMLTIINLLLKLQQQNIVADQSFSSYVDVSKGFLFDFKNLRLKTLYDCYTTIFDDRLDDETLSEVRLVFLHTVHLIFNKFSKLIIVERNLAGPNDVSPSVDVSSCLFDSLTRLIAAETTESMKKISNVVQNIIVDGTIIFFPNNDERRTKLLSLLKMQGGDVSSVILASLCNYFSGRCFASLLNLPSSHDDLEWFESWTSIETMQLLYEEILRSFTKNSTSTTVASSTTAVNDNIRPLTDLLCAQEFYVASWHYQNLSAHRDQPSPASLSLVKISEFILFSILKSSLENLLKCLEFNFDTDDDRRQWSIESYIEQSGLRNFLVLFLTVVDVETKTYDVDLILKDILDLFERLFISLDEKTASIFMTSVVDEFYASGNKQMMSSVNGDSDDATSSMLRVWTSIESSHPYDVNCHVQKVFHQNGATEFEINFDQECVLNKDHYLTFIDHNGVERKFKGTVESSHWPKTVTVRSLNHLRFVFRSDGCGDSKWGYRFNVKAKTIKQTDFYCLSDVYLLLSKVAGKIISLSLSTNVNDEKSKRLISSSIFKRIFSNGPSTPKTMVANDDDRTLIQILLISLITDDEKSPKRSEIISIKSKFIEHYKKTKLWLGVSVERTCFASFAILIWNVKGLRNEFLKLCSDSNAEFFCSDRMQKAFELATGIAQIYLEQRQNHTSLNSSDVDINDIMLTSFYHRCIFLLDYQPIDDMDVEQTSKMLQDFLLNDSLTVDETESFCCEILYRRELRKSCLKFAAKFLISSSTSTFLIRDSFLREIFRFDWTTNDAGDDYSLSSDELFEYCNFVRQLFLCYKTLSSGIDSNSIASIYINYLFISLTVVDVPFNLLIMISPDLVCTLLKFVSGKIQSSMKRRIRLTDEDSVDNVNHYEIFVSLLKKCRNDDDYCNILNSSSFYTYKLFIAQYGDVLPIRLTPSCSGCGVCFGGVRYQCTICADTMLCLKCFKNGIGPWEHFASASAHLMMRFDHKCDQCGGYIAGTRHHCAICDDYDLCDGCFKWALVAEDGGGDTKQKKSLKNNVHEASHEMLTINATRYMQTFNGVQLLNEYLSNYSWLLLVYIVRRLGTETSSSDSLKVFKTNILKPILSELVAYMQSMNDDVDGGDGFESVDFYEFDGVETKFFGLLSICGDICTSDNDGWWFDEALIIILSLLKSGELEKSSVDHLVLCLYGRLLTKVNPIVADRAMNTTSATPVDDFPDGFLTVSFLFTFGSTFLMSRDLMWSGTVAKIIYKLCRSSSQWSNVVKDYIKAKLASSTDGNVEDKNFCFLFTTGFPNSLYPGVDVIVTDGGRIKEGVIVDSSSYNDDNDDEDFVTVLDSKTRYQCKIKSKYIDFVDFSISLDELLNISEFIEQCKYCLLISSADHKMTQFNNWTIPSAFYLKGLCQHLELSTTSSNDGRIQNLTADADFIKSLVAVASKSTDLPIRVTVKSFDIVVGHVFSTGLPSLVRRMLDLNTYVFKESIRASLMPCMGQLISDFDVDWFILLAIYDLKGGDLDAADLMDLVKQINLNDRDASSFSRSVLYRAAILTQNCSATKSTPEDLSSTIGLNDVGLRTLERLTPHSIDHDKYDEDVNARDVAVKEWFGGVCESRLLREDSDVIDRHENLNNHLLAAILIRRLTDGDGKDVETKKFRSVFNLVCEKVAILYARKLLSIVMSTVSNENELYSLVISTSDDADSTEERLSKILCLINLLYVTEDVRRTARNVLKNVYELLPPNPEHVKILCDLGCQFLREGVSEKFVHYLDADCKKIDIQMHHSSSFAIRFFGAVEGAFVGHLLVEYGEEKKTVRCGNENDKILPKKLFVPTDRCTIEWQSAVEKNVDCESAWIRLDCEGVETPGRFDLGYDLLELIMGDLQIHDDVRWTEVWSSVVFVASSCLAKYKIKMLSLMTKLLNIFNDDAWKYRGLNLDFSLLSRFWSTVQSSDDDGGDSTMTSKIMSDFVRSSTLLFYTAENVLLQLNSINEYSKQTSTSSPCLKVYAQAVGIIASLSEAIGVENKSTQIMKRFYNKKHSSTCDDGVQLAEFLTQTTPTSTATKRNRPPLDD